MPRISEFIDQAAEQELRRQAEAAEVQAEGHHITLDNSPEAKSLPITPLGEAKTQLNTIDLVEIKLEEVRRGETYQALKQMYEAGELDESDLQEVFADEPGSSRLLEKIFVPEAQGKTYVGPDKDAAALLLQDIEQGLVPRQIKVSKSEAGSRPARERGVERNDVEQQLWRELCQEYTKGMSLDAIAKQYLAGQGDKQLARRFLQEVQQGKFDPAAFLMTEVLLAQPKLPGQQLEQHDWQQVSQKFIEATRAVWQDFAYGGKWKYSRETGRYTVGSDADLDAKTSLFLLTKAGLGSQLRTTAVPPGEILPSATTLDSGKKSGVLTEGQTVVIDNHQPSRGYETSSARILYRLLQAANLLEANDEALQALVAMSMDDDNGRLIKTRAQFEHSDHSLRGLQRYMGAEELYEFFQKELPRADDKLKRDSKTEETITKRDVYHKVLNIQLSDDELKGLKLNKWKKRGKQQWAGAEYWQAQSIKQAKAWFLQDPSRPDSALKPDKELMASGRLVKGQMNGQPQRFIINIVGLEDKLRAGHDAVKAYGFDGLISYNPEQNSFMVNTTNSLVDLSQALRLKQGVPVRGAMWIKPMNGQPLEVGLEDILKEIGVPAEYLKNPQGLVGVYLQLEKSVQSLQPMIMEECRAELNKPAYADLSQSERELELQQLKREAISEIRRQVYNEYRNNKPASSVK
ncbi:MAG: hypothetical protein HY974_00810 [Candidatus Kerfeldbacteria bacterium]|nr:hypothetical protein [Candidatus Kerfeldbacteria bacterium]